jgi:hypothetical protein
MLSGVDWTPQHTQMGFRYIQLNFSAASANVTGIHTKDEAAWEPDNDTLTMRWINTAAEPIAEIAMTEGGAGSTGRTGDSDSGGSSEEGGGLLNQIQALHLTSARSNWMSIPTDCPQVWQIDMVA